jgi:hypothetical protein
MQDILIDGAADVHPNRAAAVVMMIVDRVGTKVDLKGLRQRVQYAILEILITLIDFRAKFKEIVIILRS